MESLVGAVLGAVATVVAVLIPLAYAKWKRRRPLRVRRIAAATDPDLLPALELYARLFPENQRHDPDEVVRWLQEEEIEEAEGRCKVRDYLLVARTRSRICGLLYAHYYPSSRILCISYLGIEKRIPESRRSAATRSLVRYLRSELRNGLAACKEIVVELEAPSENPQQAARARARLRLFKTFSQIEGFPLREVSIGYRQPRLSLWDGNYEEESQLLLYARTKGAWPVPHLERPELERVLRFIFGEVYADQFETEPERDQQYREYLSQLLERTLRDLPEKIALR